MATSRLTSRRNENLLLFFLAVVLTMTTISCSRAETPGEYRESNGSVARYSVEQSDPVLRIACFVRLKNGEIVYPKMYYFQQHYTAVGVRSVEKVAKIYQTSSRTPEKAFLHLPTSEDIVTYLLLVRKSKGTKTDNSQGAKWIWSEWQLLTIKPDSLSRDKPIVIPAFEQLQQHPVEKEDQEVLAKLVDMYDKLEAAAIEKANKPIGPDSDVPWWAR